MAASRDDPQALIDELDAAEPRLKRLARLDALQLPSGDTQSAAELPHGGPDDRAAQARASGEAPSRPGWVNRLVSWILRGFRADRVAKWIVERFVPWLTEHGDRGQKAGAAFWSALSPQERQALETLMHEVQRDKRIPNRSKKEWLDLALAVRRGLAAAKRAWEERDAAA